MANKVLFQGRRHEKMRFCLIAIKTVKMSIGLGIHRFLTLIPRSYRVPSSPPGERNPFDASDRL
jgi:hypothetical protein